jgi:hypothetical protein
MINLKRTLVLEKLFVVAKGEVTPLTYRQPFQRVLPDAGFWYSNYL